DNLSLIAHSHIGGQARVSSQLVLSGNVLQVGAVHGNENTALGSDGKNLGANNLAGILSAVSAVVHGYIHGLDSLGDLHQRTHVSGLRGILAIDLIVVGLHYAVEVSAGQGRRSIHCVGGRSGAGDHSGVLLNVRHGRAIVCGSISIVPLIAGHAVVLGIFQSDVCSQGQSSTNG